MPAGRKAATFDNRDLMRHVGVHRISRDLVDAGLRYDLAGLVFLRHRCPPRKLIDDLSKGAQPGRVSGLVDPEVWTETGQT